MVGRVLAIVGGLLMLGPVATAKEKDKVVLPAYILQAHTVAVRIDPEAGVPVTDPAWNRDAQRAAETALLNWGRFEVEMNGGQADLIVVLRRGTGKFTAGEVRDPRQNRRPGSVEPTDTGVSVGAQRGVPVDATGSSGTRGAVGRGAEPQAEGGGTNDAFVVYEGRTSDPLDEPAGWRYQRKDGLKPDRSGKVAAVEAFKKAVDAAEKAGGKKP